MKQKSRTIAVITARGGSKRIPKKNIKIFLGKPIIAYSIQVALDTGVFDKVMVSTDSEEIAEIARKYGAEVPFLRSEKTSNDFASTADVLFEVLDRYEEIGEIFDNMVCIYPTAPFITVEKIKRGLELLKNSETNMVLPVVAFSYPPQRGYILRDSFMEMKWKENYTKRSQDLETLYHDAGQFYCYKVSAFRDKKGIMTEGIMPLIVDELEVQDIDNETDWKLAEIKYQMMEKK